ncbi:unnamed protein product [Linum trigynum]|uniref:Uncharacterized protein n=1 Tax=Linum trigynum TaxID=586398 RepID=A0AAV2CG68_9ROSI
MTIDRQWSCDSGLFLLVLGFSFGRDGWIHWIEAEEEPQIEFSSSSKTPKLKGRGRWCSGVLASKSFQNQKTQRRNNKKGNLLSIMKAEDLHPLKEGSDCGSRGRGGQRSQERCRGLRVKGVVVFE